MKNKGKSQQGITLIALVVTIILMLILAGVTLSITLGENGLIARVTDSKEKAQKERYKEMIEIDRAGPEIEAGIKNITDKEYMDIFQSKLENDALEGNLKGSTVIRKDNETVRVVTKEGYIYDVTRKETNYLGKQGEENLPDISKGTITISPSKAEWTNEDVEITITSSISEGTIQYSKYTSDNWKDYDNDDKPKMDKNGMIYARLKAGDNIGKETSQKIENIDKLDPTTSSISVGELNNKIVTLTATATDEEARDNYGKSDIKKFEFYVGGSLKATEDAANGEATYNLETTFDNQQSVYVIAYDKAGNFLKSQSINTPIDYTIKTLEELKTFRDKVNGGRDYTGITITQVGENIDLGGSAAGSWEKIKSFKGTYDGQNNKISNLYISKNETYQGLFDSIPANTTIKNLKMSNVIIKSTEQNVGAIAGLNRGTIQNITVESGNIEGKTYVGGIVGFNVLKVESCQNNASVTAILGSSGGIVGLNNIGTVQKCLNTGGITAKGTAGGIVGLCYDDSEILSCANTGAINGQEIENDSCRVGGIVGFNSKGNISNCYNTGSLYSPNEVGGITAVASGAVTGKFSTVKNCYNTGIVTGGSFSNGGIVGGGMSVGKNEDVVIQNNYWLNSCNSKFGIAITESNVGATPVNASILKGLAQTLGPEYVSAGSDTVNSGYPILKWQSSTN